MSRTVSLGCWAFHCLMRFWTLLAVSVPCASVIGPRPVSPPAVLPVLVSLDLLPPHAAASTSVPAAIMQPAVLDTPATVSSFLCDVSLCDVPDVLDDSDVAVSGP